jgi:hypothetical protein
MSSWFARRYPYYDPKKHGGPLRVLWNDVEAWWFRRSHCLAEIGPPEYMGPHCMRRAFHRGRHAS